MLQEKSSKKRGREFSLVAIIFSKETRYEWRKRTCDMFIRNIDRIWKPLKLVVFVFLIIRLVIRTYK